MKQQLLDHPRESDDDAEIIGVAIVKYDVAQKRMQPCWRPSVKVPVSLLGVIALFTGPAVLAAPVSKSVASKSPPRAPAARPTTKPKTGPYRLPDGMLDGQALSEFMLRKSFDQPDKFTAPFNESGAIGRPFHVLLELKGEPGQGSSVTWDYSVQTKNLTLNVALERVAGTFTDDFMRYNSAPTAITLVHLDENKGSAVGVNGFGVKVRYQIIHQTDLGLGQFIGNASGALFIKELTMDPAEARAAVAGMTAWADGVITEGAPGRAVVCGVHYGGATIDIPYQISGTSCVLSVKLAKISFVSRGVELAAYTPEPPAAFPIAPPALLSTLIRQPDWQRRPSAEETQRHFPDRALRLERPGVATLRCRVRNDGSLEACTVVSESPADLQFGRAALEMLPLFKLEPKTLNGELVAGRSIEVPLDFPLKATPTR